MLDKLGEGGSSLAAVPYPCTLPQGIEPAVTFPPSLWPHLFLCLSQPAPLKLSNELEAHLAPFQEQLLPVNSALPYLLSTFIPFTSLPPFPPPSQPAPLNLSRELEAHRHLGLCRRQ